MQTGTPAKRNRRVMSWVVKVLPAPLVPITAMLAFL